MPITRFVLSIILANLMSLSVGVVSAQEFPNKLIRIVAATPGGTTDFAGRLIAAGIAGPLGQPVIVENRPAIGSIETAAKAAPDGYTLLVAGGTLWILPLLQNTSWDVVR